MAERIALITGVARSGTSLLGELVATLRGVDYRFEPGHDWWPWGTGPGGSDCLTERDVRLRRRAHAWLAEQRGPLVVEKSPRMVLATRLHRALFPDVRILHIVRDGRDVACSLAPGLSAPRGSRGQVDWHHLRVPGWVDVLDSTDPGPVRGARVWARAMEGVLEDLQPGDGIVRYEDLLREPHVVLSRVASFLGVGWSEATPAALGRVSTTPGEHEAPHQDRWHVPHAVHIGRWLELPPEVAEEVDAITAGVRRRVEAVAARDRLGA